MPRCRRIAPYAITVVTALLAALAPVTPGHADLPAVSFFVVGPDGLPVVRPFVMSWVLGGEQVVVHQSRGGEDGQVTVGVPDDPMAAARIATGLPVNVMSLVMDREPGTPGLAAVPVASAINATGIPTLPVDVAGSGGQVYTLINGLIDFDTSPDDAPYEQPPDEPDCPGVDGPCVLNDWPDWARNTMVPVAENYGGGADMVATMTYQSTHRTTTSVAFSGGVSGFVEARGGMSYMEENSVGLGWAPVGPNFNKQARLQTTMQRTRSGVCWHDRTQGERHCAITTTYHPYKGVGTDSVAQYGWNDTLDVVLDCENPLDGFFDRGKGTSTGQYFGLTLGPSEDWANSHVPETPGLHAQTSVTAETTSGKGFQRVWKKIDNPQYEYHWVMVKGGKTVYDANQRGGGAGCPENSVQDVYTHASNDPDAVEEVKEDAKQEAQYRLCDPPRDTDDLVLHTADSIGPVPAPSTGSLPDPYSLMADLTAGAPLPQPAPSTADDETDPCG